MPTKSHFAMLCREAHSNANECSQLQCTAVFCLAIASSGGEYCWSAVFKTNNVAFRCLASPSVLSLMQPCQVAAWATSAWWHQQTSASSRCQSAGLLQVFAAASELICLVQPDLAFTSDHELVAVLSTSFCIIRWQTYLPLIRFVSVKQLSSIMNGHMPDNFGV